MRKLDDTRTAVCTFPSPTALSWSTASGSSSSSTAAAFRTADSKIEDTTAAAVSIAALYPVVHTVRTSHISTVETYYEHIIKTLGLAIVLVLCLYLHSGLFKGCSVFLLILRKTKKGSGVFLEENVSCSHDYPYDTRCYHIGRVVRVQAGFCHTRVAGMIRCARGTTQQWSSHPSSHRQ